jgi:hypothetical protein
MEENKNLETFNPKEADTIPCDPPEEDDEPSPESDGLPMERWIVKNARMDE